MEAALYDSSLSNTNGHEKSEELSRLQQRLNAIGNLDPDDQKKHFKLRLVKLKHTCNWHGKVNDDDFMSFAQTTLDDAPTMAWRIESIIQSSACRIGQSIPNKKHLKEARRYFDDVQMDVERSRLGLLLSQYHVRANRLDDALTHATRALNLPWTGTLVLVANEFAALMISENHKEQFIKTYLKELQNNRENDLETCDEMV